MVTAAEYKSIMQNRENFYHFLQRFYFKEVSPELLEEIQNMTFPQDCGQPEMQKGYDLLEKSVAVAGEGMLDELAAEYASIFLAAGQYQGHGAFPYESVYTSDKGLVQQAAWEEVKGIYAGQSIALQCEDKGIMEDHIAIELEYMALLTKKCLASVKNGPLKEMLAFLNNHLLNWVSAFVADVDKYATDDFYKGVAHLTLGFLQMDAEMLDEIVNGKDDNPVSYTLSNEEMDKVLENLGKDYKIYAPVVTNKKGRDGHYIVRYGEIKSVSDIVYDRQSDFSAKEVYIPIMQTMMYFKHDKTEESLFEEEKGTLIFARPCDINAIRRLDNIYLNNGDPDNYYARRRNKVRFIMMECSESYDNCYCVSNKSNTVDQYTMAVRLGPDETKVQVKSAFFIPYFEGAKETDYTPKFITENKRAVKHPVINSKQELKMASQLEYWNQFDDKCISCGGCNTVCPTCSCFDTVDVIYDEQSMDGERRRVWSSCMLDTFTMTAGGARSRKTPGANMRFKVFHKAYDYNLRFGGSEHMCVGCGRCILRCPKEIDFLDAVNGFCDVLEEKKKEAEQ